MATRKKLKNQANFSIKTVAGLVVLLGLVFASVMLLQQPSAGEAAFPAEVSVHDAYERVEAGAWVVDVREPFEWEEYHMPGATLIPLGELSARLDEIPPDREIVVVCRSGNRSATGRDILRQAGIENVTSRGHEPVAKCWLPDGQRALICLSIKITEEPG